MTADEFRAILTGMTPDQRARLGKSYNLGGKSEDIDHTVRAFMCLPPGHEPLIAQWLAMNVPGCDAKSEAEKVAAANIASAEFAKRGYSVAWWALAVAVLSMALSLIALFK